jgi:formate dehydrogenase maturation protein FdhE
MTKSELLSLAEKVNRRDSYRKLLFLVVIVIVFIALGLLPSSSHYRDFYIWGIAIVAWAAVVLFMIFTARRTKADCHEFGAQCPKCGSPLFSALYGIRKVAENGRCRRCHCQLCDDTVAQ